MPIFHARNFALDGGAVLSELDLAYECYGEMATDRRNVILVTHGISSSHDAAGTVTADRRRGWYDEIIGPGKLFDTRRYAVISVNMLGSCYGSTGPASTDPATGRPYGASFPPFGLADVVRAQHLLLQSLGIPRLVAVAGSSLGGFQAFQWAASFPDFMGGIIAADTAPWNLLDSDEAIAGLAARLAADPGWNGGDYYAGGGVEEALTAIRIDTLKSYGFEAGLDASLDAGARAAVLRDCAREWAREFDAHSLIALRRSMVDFNIEADFPRIRAKVFYVLADTDEWFPARMEPEITTRMTSAGVDVSFLEIASPHGHYATTLEPEKWVPAAREFLRTLDPGA